MAVNAPPISEALQKQYDDLLTRFPQLSRDMSTQEQESFFREHPEAKIIVTRYEQQKTATSPEATSVQVQSSGAINSLSQFHKALTRPHVHVAYDMEEDQRYRNIVEQEWKRLNPGQNLPKDFYQINALNNGYDVNPAILTQSVLGENGQEQTIAQKSEEVFRQKYEKAAEGYDEERKRVYKDYATDHAMMKLQAEAHRATEQEYERLKKEDAQKPQEQRRSDNELKEQAKQIKQQYVQDFAQRHSEKLQGDGKNLGYIQQLRQREQKGKPPSLLTAADFEKAIEENKKAEQVAQKPFEQKAIHPTPQKASPIQPPAHTPLKPISRRSFFTFPAFNRRFSGSENRSSRGSGFIDYANRGFNNFQNARRGFNLLKSLGGGAGTEAAAGGVAAGAETAVAEGAAAAGATAGAPVLLIIAAVILILLIIIIVIVIIVSVSGNSNNTSASTPSPIPGLTITKTSTDPHCDAPHQDQFCVPNPTGPTDINADIHYVITVSYAGDADVTVADPIPAKTMFVTADGNPTCDNGTCSKDSTILQWKISKGDATHKVTVRPTANDILVTNKAIATAQGSAVGVGNLASCQFTRGDQTPPATNYKSSKLLGYFQQVSQDTGVPASVLAGIARIETSSAVNYTDATLPSTFGAISGTGAVGLMQVEPPGQTGHDAAGWAKGLGFIQKYLNISAANINPYDTLQGIYIGAGEIASKAGGTWDPQKTYDTNYIHQLADHYYGCDRYYTCQGGRYSYGDDLWQSVNSCR